MSDIENEVNPIINGSQYRGVLERAVIFAVAWFLGQGNLPTELQEGIAAILVPFVLGGMSIIGGFWFNRNSAIVVNAAALPEVKSVTMTTAKAAKAIEAVNVIPPAVYKQPEPGTEKARSPINAPYMPKPPKRRRR